MYQPNEVRRLSIAVFDANAKGYDQKWSEYLRYPSAQQEIAVGPVQDGQAISKLAPGEYRVSVEFPERRRFGDLILARGSSVNRAFFVKY